MEKKKILIFGATGNVGSYLTLYAMDFFDKEKYEIIVSGKRKTDFWSRYGLTYYSVDLTKEEDFEQLPTKNIHAVMLLSAATPSYMEDYNPRKYTDSIVIGATNVLEYCRTTKADRILFCQTVFDVSEYPKDHIIRPDDKPNFSYTGDHAVYVITKNCAIELMEHYHQQFGLKKFVFRLPTIYEYSTNQYYYPNGVKTMRPLYQQINRAIKGEPLTIWGDPSYAKDMVHVYDFSQMLCKAAIVDRDGGFYNIGTGIPVTLQEQCQAIIDVFSPEDNKSVIKYIDPDRVSGGGFLMDISNAERELGYKPEYDVHRLFEDYKKEMQIDRFLELRGR